MSATRALSTYALVPSVMTALARAGFHTVEDLGTLGPVALSEASGVTRREAYEVLRAVGGPSASSSSNSSSSSSSSNNSSRVGGSGRRTLGDVAGAARSEPGKSAYELLLSELERVPIVTCCAELDEVLGGGVPLAKVTEFTGAPGIGKTQLGLQLAVDVTIPAAYGGVGGRAIYIDTEGSFIVERVVEMANGLVEHLDSVQSEVGVEHGLSLERILESITYYRVHSYIELVALVNLLPSLLAAAGDGPSVRLVVVDSIAFHFRHDFADMGVRTRVLNGLAQALTVVAEKHGLAVVLMNQVTTRGIKQGMAHLAPALGESWGHAATLRVNMYWSGKQRVAVLVKSPNQEQGSARFAVTAAGVRSVEPEPGDKRRVDDDGDSGGKRQHTLVGV